jgi:formimidoylglutamate deiminase
MFLHAAHALLDDGFHPNVRIGLRNRDIVSVTPNAQAQSGDEILPGLLLPGMPNLHSHAFQRAFAGLSEFTGGGADFWSWRDAMYRTAARITPETCIAITAWLGKELLKGGYTSLAEFHYLHHAEGGFPYTPATTMARAVAEGAASAGIALTLLIGIYETAGFDGAPLAGGQKRFSNGAADAIAMADALGHEDDVTVGLALHSLRAVPPASLHHAVANFAGRGPIHIHVAEQRAEVQACVATLGAPPVAWLLDHVGLDAAWCLVHATHATEAEINALARTGATIGLCPTTEANLGDGFFPLPALQGACGHFGIGSDSNVTLDAFAELRLLEYSQRLQLEKRNVAAAGDGHAGRALYQCAGTGGARACGRPAGRIAPGHRADLISIDPTPESAHRGPEFWLDAAIFSAPRRPVRHVMVGGTWQVRDLVHRNETAIDAAYGAALKTLAL